MIRMIGAVLAGFVSVAFLSMGSDAIMQATGIFPPAGERMSEGLFAVAATYRALFTMLGGAITMRISGSSRAVWALCLLGLAGGIAGLWVAISQPELGPIWYAASIPASAIPCTWAGALLAMKKRIGE